MEKITKNTKLIMKLSPVTTEKACTILKRYLDACQIPENMQAQYFDPKERAYQLCEMVQGAIFTGAQMTLIELSQELGQDFFNKEIEN